MNSCMQHCNVISGGDAAMEDQATQRRLHTLSCANSITLLNNQHFITVMIYAKTFTICMTMLTGLQHS